MVRAAAARVVDAVVCDGRSLDAALADNAGPVADSDRALLQLMAYGSLRFYWRYRAALRELLERPLKARDRVVESLIVCGFFQLDETRVPDHAAVSATVDAARLLRRPKFAGVVNAVMRNYRRGDFATRPWADEEARYDHPQWLIDAVRNDWPEHWQHILEANNARAPMWLRVNAKRLSVDEYAARYGIRGRRLEGAEQALAIDAPRPVAELPGFDEGEVSVQDAAAQLAGPWLAPAEGLRVLDACAAPGGKTAHLLELLPDGADLTAIEIDSGRAADIDTTLGRLGLGATVVVGDASDPRDWWDGRTFDRILLDAPCSASGVIRRHPDIKHLRRPDDVPALVERQAALLDALWPLLAPGGRLLYVTCSVLAAENDGVVRPFLERQRDAREVDVLPNYNIRDLMCEKAQGLQVLPGTQDLDGFYYACLERTA